MQKKSRSSNVIIKVNIQQYFMASLFYVGYVQLQSLLIVFSVMFDGSLLLWYRTKTREEQLRIPNRRHHES